MRQDPFKQILNRHRRKVGYAGGQDKRDHHGNHLQLRPNYVFSAKVKCFQDS